MKFVPKGPINIIPALVQIMAWRRPGDKPLSEPMMVSLTTHICVTRPQWVNSLRPSDPYMCQQNSPTLFQIMTSHLYGTKPLSETMMDYCQHGQNWPKSNQIIYRSGLAKKKEMTKIINFSDAVTLTFHPWPWKINQLETASLPLCVLKFENNLFRTIWVITLTPRVVGGFNMKPWFIPRWIVSLLIWPPGTSTRIKTQ